MRILRILMPVLLASAALTSAFASEDEARCGRIASVIDLYLAGKADEAELKAIDYSKAEPKSSDPLFCVMDFLAGAKDVDFKGLALATVKRPDAWGLASVALFAKGLSSAQKPDADILATYILNYQSALVTGASSPSVLQWRERIPVWLAWCGTGLALSDGLEPLLRKRSRDLKAELPTDSLEWISLEDFIRSRNVCANRPKPAGLAFQNFEMERYFSSLDSEGLRNLECARYDYIKGIRSYLIRVFTRSAYNGKVKLAGGKKPLAGTVALANEKFIMVREGDKSVKCEWEDLAPEQFADFLSFNAKTRSGVSGPNLSEDERKGDAAEELAHAAVLCDWYGRYQESLEYARLAIKLSPELAPQLSKLLIGH